VVFVVLLWLLLVFLFRLSAILSFPALSFSYDSWLAISSLGERRRDTLIDSLIDGISKWACVLSFFWMQQQWWQVEVGDIHTLGFALSWESFDWDLLRFFFFVGRCVQCVC